MIKIANTAVHQNAQVADEPFSFSVPSFSMSFAFLGSFYATLFSTVFFEIEIQWLRAVESTTLEKLD